MHQTWMLYRILGEIGKQSTPVALLEALPAKVLIYEDDTSPLAFTLLKTCALVAREAYTADTQADIVGLSDYIHALNMLLGRPYWARLWLV
jgi:hypothetical protein